MLCISTVLYVSIVYCMQKALADRDSELAGERNQSQSLNTDVKAKQVRFIAINNIICLGLFYASEC